MTSEPIALDVLIRTRESLIEQIHMTLTQDEREFLMSFKRGEPNWALLGVTGVEAASRSAMEVKEYQNDEQ